MRTNLTCKRLLAAVTLVGVVDATAAGTRGVRVTNVKYITGQARAEKSLRVIVTVRDLDGRLVRDAIVVIRPLPAAIHTVTRTQAGFSNAVGQARLVVPLTPQLLGRRLQFLIAAHTRTAHTVAPGSVRLPAKRTRLVAAS